MRFTVALLGLWALIATSAGAKPLVDARIVTYAVVGATEAEVRASLDRAPPGPDGTRRVGFTHPAEVHWKYEARARSGKCRVVSVTVTLTAVTTLPRWEPPAGAPRALRDRWAAFLDALARHEQGHVDIARDAAQRIEDALWRAPMPSSCAGYEAQLDAMANRIFDAAVKQQEEYDATTGFGRTQGVRFP